VVHIVDEGTVQSVVRVIREGQRVTEREPPVIPTAEAHAVCDVNLTLDILQGDSLPATKAKLYGELATGKV
jgi:hypothetical protein